MIDTRVLDSHPIHRTMIAELAFVVPCVEEIDLLNRCLATIAERFPGQKVVVVRMSSWRLPEWVESSLDIQIVESVKLSIAQAKNLGARHVNADYIALIDSDNWLIGQREVWQSRLRHAMAQRPQLIALQRAESDRRFPMRVAPTPWNFSRHTIGWSVIWQRDHFFRLGMLDERFGGESLAGCGEEFPILFRHFAGKANRTIFLPELLMGHPSLDKPVSDQRKMEYIYGSAFATMRQLRENPSLMSLYWFAWSLAGFGVSGLRAMKAGSFKMLKIQVHARLLALTDALVKDTPRKRTVYYPNDR